MKKTLLVAALMVLCFSGISNAALIWSDPSDTYFNYFGESKTWGPIYVGNDSPMTLAITFEDDSATDGSETASIWINLSWQGFSEVDTGIQTFGVNGALIDGWLTWTVINRGGDFYVRNAEVNSVPEPATLLLLGAGLIGLAGYGRKKI